MLDSRVQGVAGGKEAFKPFILAYMQTFAYVPPPLPCMHADLCVRVHIPAVAPSAHTVGAQQIPCRNRCGTKSAPPCILSRSDSDLSLLRGCSTSLSLSLSLSIYLYLYRRSLTHTHTVSLPLCLFVSLSLCRRCVDALPLTTSHDLYSHYAPCSGTRPSPRPTSRSSTSSTLPARGSTSARSTGIAGSTAMECRQSRTFSTTASSWYVVLLFCCFFVFFGCSTAPYPLHSKATVARGVVGFARTDGHNPQKEIRPRREARG